MGLVGREWLKILTSSMAKSPIEASKTQIDKRHKMAKDSVFIPKEIKERIQYWLTSPFDENTKQEIRKLQEENPQELIDAFFSDLCFGTGGLRGLMGPGTCRLNIYTIRLATQGLANYLHKELPSQSLLVVIGFDSRHHSKEFAEEAAKVLAANGIQAYLLNELRPTPFVSFVCRLKKANAAIMITASHNPKEYNGYKVYWSDGAQVVHPHDTGIVQEVKALKDLSSVKLAPLTHPLIQHICPAKDLDRSYIESIAPLQHFPKENATAGSSLKIVYTSLHGTGITLAPNSLKSWGFSSIHYVDKQVQPDPDFPTVAFPNPEYKEALTMGIEELKKTKSDLLIANDPDADRIGIVALHQEKPILLNGNEMASICVDYLCRVMTAAQTLPTRPAFVTTIVSTDLIKTIADHYKIACFEVLTGFKYIGEKIHEWETHQDGYHFVFGAEESYGYLLGTHARDKDALVSSCLIAEIALHAKQHKKTLLDLLYDIYRKYGVYREKQLSLNFSPGQEGMKEMTAIMQYLREKTLKEIANHSVLFIEDYEKRKRFDLKNNKIEPLELPLSDVLLFRLNDRSKVVIRPSGTEPKLKIYASVSSSNFHSIEDGIKECDERLDILLNALKKQLSALCLKN